MHSVQAIRALSVPAVLALALVTAPARAADDFFPTFGSNAYDVRHYDIGLDVGVTPHRIKGSARIVIRAVKRLSSFSLDLAGLKVQKVEIGGVATPFKQANDKLIVTPASPIAAGRVFTLLVAYGGHPQALDDPTLDEPDPRAKLGWTNWKKVSYVVSEPIGASNWFPVNDQPTDKASYTLSISVEKPYTAVANGVLTAVSGYGNSRLFLWEQKQPMASYLATVHVNKFKLEMQKTADRKPLRYYTTPGTTADDLAALRKTPKMVSFIESYVAPYPFDGYGSVMVDDPRLYYALETQAMSTFSSGYADEATVAHELAHQWFGDSVTVAEWRDLWLAEGFATYFEFLWTYRDDPKGFDDVMGRVYDYIVANKVGPAVVSRPQEIFADNTYYRGSVTLYALRETVGQKVFYKILKTYYETYANGNATSQDFIDVAVKVSGKKSVAKLLHAWLYEKPVPPLPGRESAARAAGAVEAPPLGAGVRRPLVAAEAAAR